MAPTTRQSDTSPVLLRRFVIFFLPFIRAFLPFGTETGVRIRMQHSHRCVFGSDRLREHHSHHKTIIIPLRNVFVHILYHLIMFQMHIMW